MRLKVGKYYIELQHGWLHVDGEVPHEETEALIATYRRTLEKNPDDIDTRFILGNVLRMDGQINKARLEYGRVVQAGDSHWSTEATRILAQIEGKSDNPHPAPKTKFLFQVHILPNPASTWRRLKLGFRRRLKRHKFITSSVTEADYVPDEKKQNQYYLKCEGVLLGVLQFDRLDWPWVFCHFHPTIVFEDVKTRFDEEINVLETDGEKWDAWYDDQIGILNLHLIDASSNREVGFSVLHIRSSTAWFR